MRYVLHASTARVWLYSFHLVFRHVARSCSDNRHLRSRSSAKCSEARSRREGHVSAMSGNRYGRRDSRRRSRSPRASDGATRNCSRARRRSVGATTAPPRSDTRAVQRRGDRSWSPPRISVEPYRPYVDEASFYRSTYRSPGRRAECTSGRSSGSSYRSELSKLQGESGSGRDRSSANTVLPEFQSRLEKRKARVEWWDAPLDAAADRGPYMSKE